MASPRDATCSCNFSAPAPAPAPAPRVPPRAMTPAYTPRRSRTPFTKLSGHGRCEGHQDAKNVLGILQEVEKRLREELAAVEEISWRLQPIIRTPPAVRSKFTRKSDADPGLKNGVQPRTKSKSKSNQNECGDSPHIGGCSHTASCVEERTSVSETKYFDEDSSLRTSGQTKPVNCTDTCTCSADDIRAPLCGWEQRPFQSREHARSQGHQESLSSRDNQLDAQSLSVAYLQQSVSESHQMKEPGDSGCDLQRSVTRDPFGDTDCVFSEGCLARRNHDTAWLLDAMHILKEYYLKRARLRLEAEQPFETAMSASAMSASASVAPMTSLNSAEKATQTAAVICEQIHASPCGHFQWTASDRIIPDIAFYISPFDLEDNRKVYLSTMK